MSKPIQTCILGVGLSGLTFHAPFILALPEIFTLHSVLERKPVSPGGKLQERFGVSTKIHNSLEAVLADPEIELIIIGTPSETHYSFVKLALQAGKHVLVDKPVTATSQEALELGELARSKNLVLYGFQNRRWDSDFLALRSILALPKDSEHSLGEIYEFESQCWLSFDRFRRDLKGTWKDLNRPASGQTYDLGTHLIDQALVLFGRPQKLTAFIQNTRGIGDPDLDDTFTIHLHYPAGTVSLHPVTVILRAHILSVKATQLRYIVRGTQGTFTKYGLDVQEDQLKVLSTPAGIYESGFGKEPENLWAELELFKADGATIWKTIWPSTQAGAYIELFKNLGAAIRDGAELAVKWKEATAVIELVELAKESSKTGRTVEVPAL
ncbi:NAD(P)-binding protein [Pluteus cervinus]|uniref:NAD(P)-binding protein n=1 Tax=Pluteus cervinus TaxID=181527 RepID=A0ACD3BDF0_9AGAR|nr:NAD(P)-binding protein [Pluteus cervinus]